MERISDGVRIARAFSWFLGKEKDQKDYLCETRDVFQARLDGLLTRLLKQFKSSSEIPAFVAVAGEIGNNCFDHNLGQWKKSVGAWFDYHINASGAWIVIADRGVGVRATLKRVVPSLKTAQQALDVAFHQVISGRSPERRGNGLKFVREVVNAKGDFGLFFQSESGKMILGTLGFDASQAINKSKSALRKSARGTFGLLIWKK